MSSSCLSGGGRAAYSFDLELVKSPATSTARTSHNTPSPASTVSESNSPLTISTRKPRMPRKRPNQTYNEAAALLSTAYPNIFSAKSLTKTSNHKKFFKNSPKPYDGDFSGSSDLLLPPDEVDFLVHPSIQSKPGFLYQPKVENFGEKCCDGAEMDDSAMEHMEFGDDFDAESILDEEIEEGIDSIMGNLGSNQNSSSDDCGTRIHEFNRIGNCYPIGQRGQSMKTPWYGTPMGIGFGADFVLAFGLRNALRHHDDANWWRFSTVDFRQISPRFHDRSDNNTADTDKTAGTQKSVPGASSSEKKKKKKKVEKPPAVTAESKQSKTGKDISDPDPSRSARSSLLLQLNYKEVLEAWSDRASPFSDEILGSEATGSDVHARLAQIELFPEGGGAREACVLRYKEKRRTRLFSKKIRYQVRKVNADQRPRMKGRFVRRSSATTNTSNQR